MAIDGIRPGILPSGGQHQVRPEGMFVVAKVAARRRVKVSPMSKGKESPPPRTKETVSMFNDGRLGEIIFDPARQPPLQFVFCKDGLVSVILDTVPSRTGSLRSHQPISMVSFPNAWSCYRLAQPSTAARKNSSPKPSLSSTDTRMFGHFGRS